MAFWVMESFPPPFSLNTPHFSFVFSPPQEITNLQVSLDAPPFTHLTLKLSSNFSSAQVPEVQKILPPSLFPLPRSRAPTSQTVWLLCHSYWFYWPHSSPAKLLEGTQKYILNSTTWTTQLQKHPQSFSSAYSGEPMLLQFLPFTILSHFPDMPMLFL